MKLWTGLTLSLLGLVGAQVDYETYDITYDEVTSVLQDIDTGVVKVGGGQAAGIRARSGVPDPILAQFAGRQLPPGIKLSDFVGPSGFQTQQFLRALQAALRKQAEENRKRQQALRQKQIKDKKDREAREKAAREAAAEKAAAEAAAQKAAEEAAAKAAAAARVEAQRKAAAEAAAAARQKAIEDARKLAAAKAAREAAVKKAQAEAAAEAAAKAAAEEEARKAEEARQKAAEEAVAAAIAAKEKADAARAAAAKAAAEKAAKEAAQRRAAEAAAEARRKAEAARAVAAAKAAAEAKLAAEKKAAEEEAKRKAAESIRNEIEDSLMANAMIDSLDGTINSINAQVMNFGAGGRGRPGVSGDSQVDSANGGRPGSAAGTRTFVATEGESSTAYGRCRQCEGLSAADCFAVAPTPCYDYHDDETDDRVCMVKYEQRKLTNGQFKTLFTSRCVTPVACQAEVKQNFVSADASDLRNNRCKAQTYLNMRNRQSECAFCQKLTADDDLTNAIFASETQLFDGLDLSTVLDAPEDYGTISGGNPFGQFYNLGAYDAE